MVAVVLRVSGKILVIGILDRGDVQEGGPMPLSADQRRILERWMRSKAIVQCPACGDNSWKFAEASYVRALLEEGDPDLTEGAGIVRVSCGNCGYVALFDAETLGIRGLWDQGRSL
jgi:predicted nucleic-acid-binding Zn-ribbon protein